MKKYLKPAGLILVSGILAGVGEYSRTLEPANLILVGYALEAVSFGLFLYAGKILVTTYLAERNDPNYELAQQEKRKKYIGGPLLLLVVFALLFGGFIFLAKYAV